MSRSPFWFDFHKHAAQYAFAQPMKGPPEELAAYVHRSINDAANEIWISLCKWGRPDRFIPGITRGDT